MLMIKKKKTIDEKIEEEKERIDEAVSHDVRLYHQGVLEGLEYAISWLTCPVEYEEVIEYEEVVGG